jgi:nicotinamidase-related amidase
MSAPIVIIDLQTGMFDGIVSPAVHDADGLVARVRSVMDWARRNGRKIAFVQQNSPPGDQLEPGTPGWQIWPALGKAPNDPTFGKSITNAFSNPELVEWVAGQGAEVILMGAATNHCIAASVGGAMAAGLKVTVVADAHSTGGATAPAIIADHNAAFAAAGAKVVTAAALTAA